MNTNKLALDALNPMKASCESIMKALCEQPMNVIQIANKFSIPIGSASNWIHRMRKDGLLVSIVAYEGGRRRPVYGCATEDLPRPAPLGKLATRRAYYWRHKKKMQTTGGALTEAFGTLTAVLYGELQ